jgi:PadR family transcriptional regulator PadR
MSKSSLYKGCLEPIVLQLLKTNRRMYGYEITQTVKEITKGELQITEGALYPLLHRLEAEGLLESEVQNADNRLRKYYSLTKAGKGKTASAIGELQAFVATLEKLINPKLA